MSDGSLRRPVGISASWAAFRSGVIMALMRGVAGVRQGVDAYPVLAKLSTPPVRTRAIRPALAAP